MRARWTSSSRTCAPSRPASRCRTGSTRRGDTELGRILLINPNTSPRTLEAMLAVARPLLPPGVVLQGAHAARGAAMIVDEAGLAVAAEEVVRIGTAMPADAVIVAAFGDPGADRLRTMLAVPVAGIGEAAIRTAGQDGRRFGIATTTPLLAAAIEGLVRRLDLDRNFTGLRLSDADPLHLAADPAAQDEALARAATRCIEEDGAEAVVIGGGPLSASAARLRQRFRTPIVEPVPAAMRAVLALLSAQ